MITAEVASAIEELSAERDEGSASEGLFASVAGQDSSPIVAITHEFFPTSGGIATYVLETLRAASAAGREVEVWAPDSARLREKSFPFAVRPLSVRGKQGWPDRLSLAFSLIFSRKDWRESILWLPEPGPLRTMMYLSLFVRLPAKGMVITLHGSEIDLFCRPWYRRMLFGRLLSKADRVSVVSRYCRESLLDRFPGIEEKVVIANGALRSDVRGVSGPVSGSFKNGRIVVLTVGRLHPRKGQLAVVEALAKLDPDLRSRFVYRCVGPLRRPAYLEEIKAKAREAGVSFEYLGELGEEELNWQYMHSDIFAMTSEQVKHSVEGFGLTYLEASAYGLPIVAHRTGGVADAVRDGYNGLKVNPDDRAGLAEAFRGLATDQQLRRRLGENGRLFARSFSWGAAVQTLFAGIAENKEAKAPVKGFWRKLAAAAAALL